MRNWLLLLFVCLVGCSDVTPTTSSAMLIHVQYTPATRGWLGTLDRCGADFGITPDLEEINPDHFSGGESLFLRLGENGETRYLAFQIGTEDIVVVVNSEHPQASLAFEAIKAIFSGTEDNWSAFSSFNAHIQVYAYPQGTDIQGVFSEFSGIHTLVSDAQLVSTPDEMTRKISEDTTGIGFLPRSWLGGSMREIYSLPDVPVLLNTEFTPQDEIANFIACLQEAK